MNASNTVLSSRHILQQTGRYAFNVIVASITYLVRLKRSITRFLIFPTPYSAAGHFSDQKIYTKRNLTLFMNWTYFYNRIIYKLPLLLLFISWAVVPMQSAIGDSSNAVELQKRGIERLDGYVDYFRRTFDASSQKHELDGAEFELQQSALQLITLNMPKEAALSLTKLGDAYRYQEKWNASLESYQQAQELSSQGGFQNLSCLALIGRARTYLYGFKTPSSAIDVLAEAMPIASSLSDRECLFLTWNMTAQANIMQNNLIGALDAINRAFAVEESLDDASLLYGRLDRADIYITYAKKCDYQREFESCLHSIDKALADYSEALDLAKTLGWTGLEDETVKFISRAEIQRQLINQQKTLHQTLSSMDHLFAPASPEEVPITTNFSSGENNELALIFNLLENERGIPQPDTARGAFIHAMFSQSIGELDDATSMYLRAAKLLDEGRDTLHTESARGGYIEERVEFFYNAVVHLLDVGKTLEAFNMMERARSRVLADLVASKELIFGDRKTHVMYGQYMELKSEIAQAQTCLDSLNSPRLAELECHRIKPIVDKRSSSERGVAPVAETNTIKTQPTKSNLLTVVNKLYEKLVHVKSNISNTAPSLATLISSDVASLSSVQKLLIEDDSEYIAYTSLESQLLIWHVNSSTVSVRSVIIPRAALNKKLERLKNSLSNRNVEYDHKLAHELYLLIFSPIEDLIRSNHLVISPHEGLNHLPFQALVSGLGNKHYLGEEYQITYSSNATLMTILGKPHVLDNPTLFAAADPSLKHARSEVNLIGELFSGTVVADKLIAESNLKSLVKGQDVVHLAIHGSFDANQPLLSHLSFGKDDQDDGKLSAAEMYGLQLQGTKLMVLSACETGRGQTSYANETLGMIRGLTFAGAEAIMLSAWPIDDEATSHWMSSFYTALKANTPGESAQIAVKQMLENERFGHPYFWSPFLLVSR